MLNVCGPLLRAEVIMAHNLIQGGLGNSVYS